VLELREIAVHYGQIPALRGITLTIDKGSIVSLLGANGAGKTTLLRTICGVLKPTSGSILFQGRDITSRSPHEVVAFGMGLVPEGRRLFTSLTVEDNLKAGSYLPHARKDRRESLRRVYDMFPKLEERRHQVARTLSGGEQQMLAIGRALMAKPQLLMLDEPSLGLAPVIVAQIFSIIREINRLGTTILLVEQNVVHSLRMSHRAFVVENGRIVLSGTGDELLRDERTRQAYFGTYRDAVVPGASRTP
jgi:branched-chain amino acid transport system ATP-binding protein